MTPYQRHRLELYALAEACERAAESFRLAGEFVKSRKLNDSAIRYRWLAERDSDVERLFEKEQG